MTHTTQYQIRRIAPGSVIRISFLLGWVVLLCPTLCVAGIFIQVLRQINQAITRVEPIELSMLGQEIASIDLLNVLRLSETAQTIGQLSDNVALTFTGMVVLLLLAGVIVGTGAMLLFSVGYNILASIGGGFVVDLRTKR
ncbi:MAG: hypothetical protein GFH27_549285n213 [Chloroflexi bacterium AL-W]|nr:hypothetical protein [Chloroflexi bacterium AL-N1]NOK65725.1 hypothetical protein [Chloroflexi bacterium AL-N10]NOK74334.1 hypothetical protein [Chloroflexi bacterium AL-N5]NOK80758.1 hypothetical protein [Chloroflexi bacterium AL-W]NOK88592.1 hypothetical protein [Chloroflexi bacterium AL-N15]